MYERILLRRAASLAFEKGDEDFVYELPFEPGQCFYLLQGYGGSYSHTGESYYSLDFRIPEGTPLCAARSGEVVAAIGEFEEGGSDRTLMGKDNHVQIQHADGSIAYYGHLKFRGLLAARGARVEQGSVIGLSGNTGWSTEPHLHFHVTAPRSGERQPTRFRLGARVSVELIQGRWYRRPGGFCYRMQKALAHLSSILSAIQTRQIRSSAISGSTPDSGRG